MASASAATTATVGPATPVAVKVAFGGEYRRFRIPLGELGPVTFPTKIAGLLGIPADQSLLLERYSDSASSFITLDSDNQAIYKQLYRAAKAKLKLRIRATARPAPESSHEEEIKVEADNDSLPPPPPLVSRKTKPVLSPSPAKPEMSDKSILQSSANLDAGSQNWLMAMKMHQAEMKNMAEQRARELILQPTPFIPPMPTPPRRAPCPLQYPLYSKVPPYPLNNPNGPKFSQETLVSPTSTDDARENPTATPLLTGMTQFSVCCNVCHADIPDVHWHCSICQGGDYDLCANCVDLGHHCEVDSHFLIKRIVENGRVINATLETISKKFGPSTMVEKPETQTISPGNKQTAFKLEDISWLSKEQETHRTCNSCIRVFEESLFVSCTVCEDYDLCEDCLQDDRHGHHPGHFFEPIQPGAISQYARALCNAGRNKYHHAICDSCDKKIHGIRHKCFDCPDYDLCDDCAKDARKKHPGHRFAPLYDAIQVSDRVATEHVGVTCDGPLCKGKHNRAYIRGVRYKCAICHDTDFCAACEALPTSANSHNRTHPLIKFRTPVAHAWVTTYDDQARGSEATPMGDRMPRTYSKATETTAPAAVHAATQVQTVAEFKPLERNKEAAAIESQRVSPATLFEGKFVSDTVADGTKVSASQIFSQTWKIRNPGPMSWPAGCCLRFVGGDRMLNMDSKNPASIEDLERAVSSNAVDHEVVAGQSAEFTVTLKAPLRVGGAISYWRVKTPEGQAFGDKLWCHIEVTEPASSAATTSQPSESAMAAELARLTKLVSQKNEEIEQLTHGMTNLQHQLAGATAAKAAAIGDVQNAMQRQRTELLQRLEEVKAESERIRTSQMIFPKLEKESPDASVYETARQEPSDLVVPEETPAKAAARTDEELVEDLESLAVDDETTDDGFLTDEEYDILDNEFEEAVHVEK